jgi:hypothetical protein
MGRAIAQAVRRRIPTVAARFTVRSGHVGSVVDEVALMQVFSDYFSFHCQFSFYRLLHTHLLSSSGAGTTADAPSELSVTPSQETKTKKKKSTPEDGTLQMTTY